jgi:hypothetical protein
MTVKATRMREVSNDEASGVTVRLKGRGCGISGVK